MTAKTIWYLPLEDVKSRYTNQLCTRWIPDALNEFKAKDDKIETVRGVSHEADIKVGHVLDATGRGIYSLTQVAEFLKQIEKGNVKNNDVVYIQDYWTPGIEAFQYAFDMYKLSDVKVYSMLHAQSVDEFDFTYPMRNWMRPIELGYDQMHMNGGIFVGSTIHKEQLRSAGFKAPIHVVSLPFGYNEVQERMKGMDVNTNNAIVFSSRMDTEKNPNFMMDVAEQFLREYTNWDFIVTTSGKELRSNDPALIDRAHALAVTNPRFKIRENLSKDEYYKILCSSKIQLNTSLQDYVSWTLLEATTAGCDIVYPDYRSFPECVPGDRRYQPWSVDSAMSVIRRAASEPRQHEHIPWISDYGRRIEGYIITHGIDREVNLWKDLYKSIDILKEGGYE